MEHSIDLWSAFFKTGAVLLFVILFLLFLLYLLKRFSNLGIIKSRHDHINVISIHHFSPREKVVLVEVMGKTLLLGVTSQNIQTLATINGETPHDEHTRDMSYSSEKSSNENSKSVVYNQKET